MDRFLAQYLILSQTVRSLCLHVHKLAHYYHNNNNSGGGGGGHLLHAATYRIPKAAGGQSIGYQRFRLMKYFVLLVLEVDDAILRNESISLRIGNIGELILSISMCVCVCVSFLRFHTDKDRLVDQCESVCHVPTCMLFFHRKTLNVSYIEPAREALLRHSDNRKIRLKWIQRECRTNSIPFPYVEIRFLVWIIYFKNVQSRWKRIFILTNLWFCFVCKTVIYGSDIISLLDVFQVTTRYDAVFVGFCGDVCLTTDLKWRMWWTVTHLFIRSGTLTHHKPQNQCGLNF